MKKTALIVSLALLLSFLPTVSYAAEGKTISSAAALISFRDEVNSGNTYEGQTVTLSSGINLSGTDWNPIGTEEHPFKGTFDGGNNTITGLEMSGESTYAGLFGCNGGTIKNLNVKTSANGLNQYLLIEQDGNGNTISKTSKRLYAGTIAAYSTGNIINCTSDGAVKSQNAYSYTVSGGICGINKGAVDSCTNNARVSAVAKADWTKLYADAYAGGICGINEGTVTSCTSSAQGVTDSDGNETMAAIFAQSTFSSAAAGGAIGDNRGIASDITASGTVHSKIDFGVYNMSYAYAGGICGSNTGGVSDSSSDCYVRSSHDNQNRGNFMMCGGIAGYNKEEITNCTFSGLASAGNTGDYSIKGYVGGVCGYNYGRISKCEFAKEAKITDPRIVSKHRWTNMYAVDYAGGICGYNDEGIITQCAAKGSIYPKSAKAANVDRSFFCGGIAGGNKDGVISLSYSNSDIILDGDGKTAQQLSGNTNLPAAESKVADAAYYAGGLAGENSGRIENCYYYCYSANANSIKAGKIGGLCGINSGAVDTSYARANVDTELIVSGGGIAAVNEGYISNSYFVIDSFEEEISGTKKKAAELQSRTAAAMQKNPLFKEWAVGACWTAGTLKETNFMPVFAKNISSPEYSDGDGTAQSPYIVKNEKDLYNIRFNKSAHYKIVNDIAYSGNWSGIGDMPEPFTGTVDGNHHTVTFAGVNGTAENCGFIGYGENCTVKNLNIAASVTAVGNSYTKLKHTGMIIAYGKNVNIENCLFNGSITVSAEYAYTGAIAGDVTGTIKGCRSYGTLSVTGDIASGHSASGGIAGRIDGNISASESRVNISINGIAYDGLSETGGLCGIITGTVDNSCYSGTITDSSANEKTYAGGLSGTAEGDILTSYSNAEIISSGENDGGVSGKIYNGIFDRAYFNTDKAAGNGIGNTATESDFTESGLLSSFRSNGAYIWTADKETGKMTLLHITPEWVVDDGFTKLALKSNSDTCEIYYTTDGSNPIGGGIKYEKPFSCDDLSTLKYYAKDGGTSTDIFDYGQAHISLYPIQFTEIPKNQNNAAINSENISETTAVTVKFISDITDTVKLYMAFYDENGIMKFANCKETVLTSGENSLAFDNISVDGASSIRLFVWNGTMVPYTPEVKF